VDGAAAASAGVRLPPTLLMMKMNNTTFRDVMRYLFILIQGRIISIDAPVVPITFASTAPMAKKIVFTIGVASPLTRMLMPPEITNRDPTSAMKLTYS
jgi:hypothetical protein